MTKRLVIQELTPEKREKYSKVCMDVIDVLQRNNCSMTDYAIILKMLAKSLQKLVGIEGVHIQ